MPKKETRSITMGPAATRHLIEAQAGTLGKAILEYIMNSVDAGASRIDISLHAEGVKIIDDGMGFSTREHIEKFFEILCFEHPERVNDHRTFGRFGMGRAQLFSFAKTTWRTHTFQMSVDVRARGLDYDLWSGLDKLPGCAVSGTFYEPLTSSEIHSAVTEVSNLAAYCSVPVIVNGTQVSIDVSAEKWDITTDDAYFRLRPGGELSVYNQGVLVRSYPGYSFGTGGIVVSKTELMVNFARNDILQSKCDAWKRIAKVLRKHSGTEVAKKKSLTDDQRRHLVGAWASGEVAWSEIESRPVFKTVAGRSSTPEYLFRRFSGNCAPCSVALAEEGRMAVGDAAHRMKAAIVFHPEFARWLGLFDSSEHSVLERAFFDKLRSLLPDALSRSLVLEPMDSLEEIYDTDHEIIPEKELSKRDRSILNAIRHVSSELSYVRCCATGERSWPSAEYPSAAPRQIVLGHSRSALGWTDGDSFIALEIKHARLIQKGLDGVLEVVSTLLHEQAHDQATAGDHGHDQDFYERFHDMATYSGRVARIILSRLFSQFRRAGIKPNSALMRAADLHQVACASAAGECQSRMRPRCPDAPLQHDLNLPGGDQFRADTA